MYSKVTNGTPGPPQELPHAYANVSNFHGLDNATLATFGFFPVVPQPVPGYDAAANTLEYDLSFDPAANTVTQSWRVVPIPVEPPSGNVTLTGRFTLKSGEVLTIEHGLIKAIASGQP